MSAPETKLDTRFSDADAVATSWNDTRQALEKAELFWITTVRRDGRPHITPLVAVWLDDAIYFCTGPSEQKAVNLTHNPYVVLTTGCNDWEHGTDIVVEGTAVSVTGDPNPAHVHARLHAIPRRVLDRRPLHQVVCSACDSLNTSKLTFSRFFGFATLVAAAPRFSRDGFRDAITADDRSPSSTSSTQRSCGSATRGP